MQISGLDAGKGSCGQHTKMCDLVIQFGPPDGHSIEKAAPPWILACLSN